MKKAKRIMEKGAAGVTIELSDGNVQVRHIDGGLLMTGKVYEGYWNDLWKQIEKSPLVTVTYRAK
jgi:hypothetical protein